MGLRREPPDARSCKSRAHLIDGRAAVRLHTERLILRPAVADDLGALVEGLNQWEVAQYLTVVPYPYSDDDGQVWINGLRPAEPGLAHFVVELPGAGMIGAVGLSDELGYWLDQRFHGRGYMTEACVAMLDWHFAALPDDLVYSGAHVGNRASLNVQRKLGFVDTGTRSDRFVRSQNRHVAHVVTTLTHTDYKAARQRLTKT